MMIIIIAVAVVVVLAVVCIAICLCLWKCRKTETTSRKRSQKVHKPGDDKQQEKGNVTNATENKGSSSKCNGNNKETKPSLLSLSLKHSPKENGSNSHKRSPVRPYTLTIDPDGAVVCQGQYADKKLIAGKNDINIRNIHRITGPPGSRVSDIVIEKCKSDDKVRIKSNYRCDPRELCKLLQYIIEGEYYNGIVDQYNKYDNCYENIAYVGTDADDCDHVMKTTLIKKSEFEMKQEAEERACQNLFNFFNNKRDINTIDLHFLQNFQDEDGSTPCKAVRALESRLIALHDTPREYLEIILDDDSDHSNDVTTVRESIESYLYDREQHYDVLNKSSILLTFKEYSGPWPCTADFFCSACQNVWVCESCEENNSQTCSICAKQCRPLKLRKTTSNGTPV